MRQDFKDKVVYQIYPRSFKDSSGNGIGDLKGIVSKLDYLQELGIDYIWMNPIFLSPQNDNGYDVADYRAIDPQYGTMEDLEELIEEAKKRNIYLMFDMVFNHTSTSHEWFQKALQGDPKYRNYYIFKEPKADGGMPNNWQSKFGGPAWKYVPELGRYYLHLFDESQADLNWENDEVIEELADVIRFWLDKGVRGFRFDVINEIAKSSFADDPNEFDGRQYYTDQPKNHDYLHHLHQLSFPKDDPYFITVGEMSSTTVGNCQKYTDPKNEELTMAFNFHHLKVDYKDKQKWTLMDFDFHELKELFFEWQEGMQEHDGWNALFWNCHDQPRSLSRFGDPAGYPKQSAKMLATAIHLMQGTPYIYQGEEIGMENAGFTDLGQYRDVESINAYHILKKQGKSDETIYAILREKSRDNARTPMQWDDSDNAGFTSGTPWIGTNPNYRQVNVEEALKDKDSVFYHYKKLIGLRKNHPAISRGRFIPILKEHDQVYGYIRQDEKETILVLNNFYGKDCSVDLGEIDELDRFGTLISNYPEQDLSHHMNLRPYESAAWILNEQ